MIASSFTLGYLMIRVTLGLLRTVSGKESEKFSLGKLVLEFGIFSFMTFLVFLEVYVITDLLTRQYTVLFSNFYTVLTFVLGYEISDKLLDKFYGEDRISAKKNLSLKTFLHFLYNSFFGLIFLIIASFIVLYF